MSVPARKKSSSAVKRRRSHHSLSATNIGTCENCQAAVQPHRVCKSCGFYKGREAVKQSAPAAVPAKTETTEAPEA